MIISFSDVDPQNAGSVDYDQFLEISKYYFVRLLLFTGKNLLGSG